MSSTLSRAIASFPNRFDPGVLGALPAHLQETIRDWDPARRADVAAAIARVSREMVPARATRP